jgi:carbon monoxide dehydrogenase subunit G
MYILDAPPEILWEMLMDPMVLEKVTPGIKSLVSDGDDRYKAISMISVGPVKGAFEGTLAIKDKVAGKSCLLVIDQKSKMGNVIAEVGIVLADEDTSKSKVNYTGEAKLSGMLARMGQRILSGVVSTLSRQFFQGLERELATK